MTAAGRVMHNGYQLAVGGTGGRSCGQGAGNGKACAQVPDPVRSCGGGCSAFGRLVGCVRGGLREAARAQTQPAQRWALQMELKTRGWRCAADAAVATVFAGTVAAFGPCTRIIMGGAAVAGVTALLGITVMTDMTGVTSM